MKSLFWLKLPSPICLEKKKIKQVNIKLKEAHRRRWEINKILSKLLQAMPCGVYVSGVGDEKTYVPST